MSDDMLHGVLNMPLPDDPKEIDLVTWLQFRDRAREASARIRELEAERDRLWLAFMWIDTFSPEDTEAAKQKFGLDISRAALQTDTGGASDG